MKLNHKRIWLAILAGNIILFFVTLNQTSNSDIAFGSTLFNFPFIVLGSYFGGFIINLINKKTHRGGNPKWHLTKKQNEM